MTAMREKHGHWLVERFTIWIGSPVSILVHTAVFFVFFAPALFGALDWSLMLLVLTTVVSLEAIYLAIFIQMTVNRHAESLKEVEADVDEIQEDIDEIQEDVGEMSEDLEEIVSEEKEPVDQAATLERLTTDVRRVLAELEQLKKGK